MVWNIVKVRAAIRTYDIRESSNRAVDLYTNMMLPDGSVGEEFYRQRSGSQQFDHFAEHSFLFPSRGDDDFSAVELSRAINSVREPVVHPAGSPNTHSRLPTPKRPISGDGRANSLWPGRLQRGSLCDAQQRRTRPSPRYPRTTAVQIISDNDSAHITDPGTIQRDFLH